MKVIRKYFKHFKCRFLYYRDDNINDIFLFTVTILIEYFIFAPSFNQDVLLVSVSVHTTTTAGPVRLRLGIGSTKYLTM